MTLSGMEALFDFGGGRTVQWHRRQWRDFGYGAAASVQPVDDVTGGVLAREAGSLTLLGVTMIKYEINSL